MTAREFKEIVTLLRKYYRDDGFGETVSRVYWEAWRNYPYSVVIRAVKDAIMNLKGYGRVPELPDFQPFIERYAQRLNPQIPRHFRTLLDEEREAKRHAHTLPWEVQQWNVRFMKTIVHAINNRQKMDHREFVATFGEQFATLWAERQRIDAELGEYDPYWRLSFATFLDVLERIDQTIRQLVHDAFFTPKAEGKHVGSH